MAARRRSGAGAAAEALSRPLLIAAFLALAAALLLIAAPSATAAKPCQGIEHEGRKYKVGVIYVSCAEGRRVAERFYETWNPEPGPDYYAPIAVEGFSCAAGSSGADLNCQSGRRWVVATSRPYVDVRTLHPERDPKPKPAKPYWNDCGRSASYALKSTIAHRVPCGKARRLIRKVWRASQRQGGPASTIRVKSFTCRLTRGSRPILCARGNHQVRGPLPG